MKIICAWCNKEIREIPPEKIASGFEVSHGICRSCKKYFFADRDLTLDKFLNRLEAPVFMVNPEGDVVLANEKALRFLGKDLDAVSGFKGGDVMECAYAKLPEGCGNTVHCAACTIRNNVMETFRTGKSLKTVPASLNRRSRDSIDKIEFLNSTEKVDDIVLLRIDEVLE
jgi:PAS domain-containing protein